MPLSPEAASRFQYHPATEDTAPLHNAARTKAADFAEWITENVPNGRHQSLALTAVQEAMMWANAGIACDTAP